MRLLIAMALMVFSSTAMAQSFNGELFYLHQPEKQCCSDKSGVGVGVDIGFTDSVFANIFVTENLRGAGLAYKAGIVRIGAAAVLDTLDKEINGFPAKDTASGGMIYIQTDIQKVFIRAGVIAVEHNRSVVGRVTVDGEPVTKTFTEKTDDENAFVSIGVRF